MRTGFIEVDNNRLHFVQAGDGPKLLLAFHGYGENAYSFAPLFPELEREYTTIAIDLPFHGNSQWQKDAPAINDVCLSQIVEEALRVWQKDKLSLMGYSIGGRLCLGITAACPTKVDRALLMATDGLYTNPYYYFATHTSIGSRVFAWMLGNSRFTLKLAGALQYARLIPNATYKLSQLTLSTTERRSQLWETWQSLRFVTPSRKVLKAAIRENKIVLDIFMGAQDKILPPSLAYRFASGLPSTRVHVLQRGHRIFDERNAKEIVASILEQ